MRRLWPRSRRWWKSVSITSSKHQELMLTDILHAFAQNPIPPAYDSGVALPCFKFGAGDEKTGAGDDGSLLNEGIKHCRARRRHTFHFDNEKTRAPQFGREPVRLARNLVTNAEWLAFMKDGGSSTRRSG